MTTDEGENNVLQVIKTVPGNHARGHFNQREIDVITQEVMPEYSEYDILLKAIAGLRLSHTDVLCHYPLSRLIADWNQLDRKEKVFAGKWTDGISIMEMTPNKLVMN